MYYHLTGLILILTRAHLLTSAFAHNSLADHHEPFLLALLPSCSLLFVVDDTKGVVVVVPPVITILPILVPAQKPGLSTTPTPQITTNKKARVTAKGLALVL